MGEVVSNPASDPSPRSRSKEGAKHTSGEWYVTQQRFSRHDGIALEGDKIPVVKMCGACEAIVASVGCSAAEAESNARLIAAAPELLEALKLAIAAYENPNIWLDDARAAIAKAEGGE